MARNKSRIVRFGPLDGLRGVAVLIVLLSHTSGREMAVNRYLQFHGIGHIGVYLFFCLSAYLLVGKLLKKPLTKTIVKSFFIKRFLRIWPLYFIVLIFTIAMQYFEIFEGTKYLYASNGWHGVLQHFVFLPR